MTAREHLRLANFFVARAARHWLAHRLEAAEKLMILARLHRISARSGDA